MVASALSASSVENLGPARPSLAAISAPACGSCNDADYSCSLSLSPTPWVSVSTRVGWMARNTARGRSMKYAGFSGFTGERAERTWASRMRILADHGFIEIKGGSGGPINYVLVFNPYTVVKELHAKGLVDQNTYNALLERMIEIRADDLQNAPTDTEDEEASGATSCTVGGPSPA
jgi:hypothetical protein